MKTKSGKFRFTEEDLEFEKAYEKAAIKRMKKEKLDMIDWIFIIVMYIVFAVMVVMFYFAKS